MRVSWRTAAAVAAVLAALVPLSTLGVAQAHPRQSVPRLLAITAGQPQVRPAFMALYPAGASAWMDYVVGPGQKLSAYGRQGAGIHWISWSRREARGTGTLYGNACNPTCQSGNFQRYGLVLVASRVHRGRFTRLVLIESFPGHVVRSPMTLDVERAGSVRFLNWRSP